MKATHSGHCQACGSLQKLPKGKLSLHGYSVTYGFFNGVCRGAKHEPFEKSCALVATFIEEAKARLVTVQAFVKKLRMPATEAKCWVSNYEGAKQYFNGYVMRYVTITEEVVTHDTFSYSKFSYVANGQNGQKDVTHKLDNYGSRDTLLELCSKKNADYAHSIEQRDVTNLRKYIAWQTERVATWKEAELLPVSTKNDKQEFKLVGDDVMTEEAK